MQDPTLKIIDRRIEETRAERVEGDPKFDNVRIARISELQHLRRELCGKYTSDLERAIAG